MSLDPQILEVYKELGTHERHFNTIQGVYRGLASTWFLGCFTAIGFIYSSQSNPNLPFNADLVSSLISLGVSTCILLFWILDVVVYHRLLTAVIKVTNEFEKENGLPKLREAMREETKNFRARMAISLYYFVPVIILLATSFVFLLSSKAATGSETQILVLIWQVGAFVGALRLFIFCEGNHLVDLLSIMKKSNKRTFAQPDRR